MLKTRIIIFVDHYYAYYYFCKSSLRVLLFCIRLRAQLNKQMNISHRRLRYQLFKHVREFRTTTREEILRNNKEQEINVSIRFLKNNSGHEQSCAQIFYTHIFFQTLTNIYISIETTVIYCNNIFTFFLNSSIV